jgi:hypothetical protein
LRIWIPEFVRKTREYSMWLTQIVPPRTDSRDYVDALKDWAARSGGDISITKEDVASGDMQFKIVRWFDL